MRAGRRSAEPPVVGTHSLADTSCLAKGKTVLR